MTLGWVLDNDVDEVSLDAPFLGFDLTAVLDDPTVRGPVMAYLFHRVESLLDGRRLVLAVDEFWKGGGSTPASATWSTTSSRRSASSTVL